MQQRNPSYFFQPKPNLQILSSNKQNFTIKLAEKIDGEELAKLAKTTYEETYPEMFTTEQLDNLFGIDFINQIDNPKYVFIIARTQEQIIGYGKIIFQNDDIAFLDKLYVLKAFQGVGCGSALLKALYQEAYGKKIFRIEVGVSETNKKAIPFYEKFGFILTSEKRPYYFLDGRFSDYDLIMKCNDITNQLKFKQFQL